LDSRRCSRLPARRRTVDQANEEGGFGRPFHLLKRFAVVDIVNALYHCDTTGAL
jgi:hypothetical protein